MSELKNCPFCNGEAELITSFSEYGVETGASCERCDAYCESLDKWNTRADGWIDTNDKWPERICGNKIWCFYDGLQFESECDEDLIWCNIYGNPFTHWMPLPTCPARK